MSYILAILGLSFLIFIHELGHYFMARRVGMRVETFAIGFGRPIYSWEHDGVTWQIGWLPFGGYVKIAGTETDTDVDPYEVSDGFFGKGPLDRIKVAFMGPFVNLAFAFVAFALFWSMGGRVENFSQYTNKIGWVDERSELFALGIRPGDEITSYDGDPYNSSKDHVYAPMISGEEIEVQGDRVDYKTGERTPFSYVVRTYPHPGAIDSGVVTAGVLQPASYVIYNKRPNGAENPLPEGSPMEGSGLQYGDRILWVDGEEIFSIEQLHNVINEGRALLTIQRGQETLLRHVPRVRVQELRPDSEFREELIDWQYESGLTKERIERLYAIPYNLTYDAVVEKPLRFIDDEVQVRAFPEYPFSPLDEELLPGDKIIAVDGNPVSLSHEMFLQLQENRVNIVVQRNRAQRSLISWKDADASFDRGIDTASLQKIAQSIGTGQTVKEVGDLVLLNPVIPKKWDQIILTPEKQARYASEIEQKKRLIEKISDAEKREQALKIVKGQQDQLMLGVPALQDRHITYNPEPMTLFMNIFSELWQTLLALFSGALSIKWLSGPVGIVNVVQSSWAIGIQEVLYWLGVISLNLGFLNLLPIPILDGGTIVLSFFEMVSGRRLHPKTLEKLIIPFALLLIGFFVFLTFYDVIRLFGIGGF